MIVANLATYPPRSKALFGVLNSLASQVDCINLILNEYEIVPDIISRFENINAVIPKHDTKDAGKFYCHTSEADYVLLVDDDIIYPQNYVQKTISNFNSLDNHNVIAGYHSSIYQRPPFPKDFTNLKRFIKYYIEPNLIVHYRKIFHYSTGIERPIFVDQIGSGTVIMRGKDMPPYDYMKTSQKFVDVRLAKWCFERDIARVCLPRTDGWLASYDKNGEIFEETIYRNFTKTKQPHVAKEIRKFAFKTPAVGRI